MTLCTYNNNWQANMNLGGDLSVGAKAEVIGATLFDVNKTWSQSFYNLQFPYNLEMISGNNQNYDMGNALSNKIKVKVTSNKGFSIPGALVHFDAKDGGSVSQATVTTNAGGYAEIDWTPAGSSNSQLEAYLLDCNGNNINNSPQVFQAYENAGGTNCAQSSLSANVVKNGNTLTVQGQMGNPPYEYSTDGNSYSSTAPQVSITPGQTYDFYVKDSDGCVASESYTASSNPCQNSGLSLNLSVSGYDITANAQGGNPPYEYSLDGTSNYSTTNTFNNVSTGTHTVYVKDDDDCTDNESVYVHSSTGNCSFPTVATDSITNITTDSATSGGNVTSDGGCSVTSRGVCWSTSQNPTINDSHTTDGNGTGSFTSTITGLTSNTTYYVRAYATNNAGTAYGNQKSFTTSGGGGGSYPSGTVHCIAGGATVVDVTNPITGETWMDRNLGAAQQATSSTDSQAYGDLYQWGRFSDGHQCRNSSTTSNQAGSDTPGHGDFITGSGDWRSPKNNNLWQGVNGTNNPCPNGYRLPTKNELNTERQSWSSDNASGAYASPLKLPLAGYRSASIGSLNIVGSYGLYWSSTVDGSLAYRLSFYSGNATVSSNDRASGRSVRCLKD